MFYQEQEKTVLLNLLSRILPHHNSREFREQLMAQSSESLRQIARNNLERVASIQLMDLGVQPHMMGYAYCRSAICQVLSNPVHQGKRAPACYGKSPQNSTKPQSLWNVQCDLQSTMHGNIVLSRFQTDISELQSTMHGNIIRI